LTWYFDYVVVGIDGLAIYRAPWKLVDPDSPRLYDVYADPLEEHDVAAAHPEIVAALVLE
jgi:arylsulfatase A-like enzyme